MVRRCCLLMILLCLFSAGFSIAPSCARNPQKDTALDEKVRKFLDSRAGRWHDMNIPESDGRLLYDTILKNKYKNAVEIGTSTGLSGIWIAWALSKTGGRLTTIEIDESRYRQALANFKEAGLSDYIDARLADAHQLVGQLNGPVDFVFCDADKDWYKNYFTAMAPKLRTGGCYTAHNVRRTGRRHGGFEGGSAEFLSYVERLPNFETTVDESGGGVSFSYKKAEE